VVNPPNQVEVLRHRRELPADGERREEQAAIKHKHTRRQANSPYNALMLYLHGQKSVRRAELRAVNQTSSPDYGVLNGLARQRLNTKLIAQNWDDFLRLGGSLKMGAISGSELIRSLQFKLLRSSKATAEAILKIMDAEDKPRSKGKTLPTRTPGSASSMA
jgi:hypothetical protein